MGMESGLGYIRLNMSRLRLSAKLGLAISPRNTSRCRALANLYHSCMRLILSPITACSKTGITMTSRDGISHQCHPIYVTIPLVPSLQMDKQSAIVTIPLVPSRQMDEESAMTLWKKNIASWRTTDRRRGAHPVRPRAANGELVDTKVRMRRITARIDAEAEDAEEQLSIARLVSAEGSTWDYSCRAGVMTSRSTVT